MDAILSLSLPTHFFIPSSTIISSCDASVAARVGFYTIMADAFANPFPHTALNHFLRASKAQLSDSNVIFVATGSAPTLDHVVAAIAYTFLRTLSTSSTTYIPLIQASRSATLDRDLQQLTLALQASLIGPENLVFLDDDQYRSATAFRRQSSAILVGGSADKNASSFRTQETLDEWQQVHGLKLVGVIDHHTDADILYKLENNLVSPRGDADVSLASLVALHFKSDPKAKPHFSRELANLLLSAILVETENLTESRSSSLDLGAVGFLVPKSSFQSQDEVPPPSSATTPPQQGQAQDDINYDAFVPTFPDLDSLYSALKAATSGQLLFRDPSKPTATVLSTEDVTAPENFEWNLITGSLQPLSNETSANQVPDFAKDTIEGRFSKVLNSPLATRLLHHFGSLVGKAASQGTDDSLSFDKVTFQSAAFGTDTPQEALCIAIASLHAFVQLNWTGPDLPSDLTPYALLRSSASDHFPPRSLEEDDMEKDARRIGRMIHRASLEALVFKGEPAYHLCQAPFFLVFARSLIEALWESPSHQGSLASLSWWRLRASTVHSQVLDEPAAFGKQVFDPVQRLIEQLEIKVHAYERVHPTPEGSRNPWASLAARLVLERGVALQRLGNDREASEKFVEAAKINGLRYQLSGALGKRTKFQKEDKTQLVLLAQSLVADGGKEEDDNSAEKTQSLTSQSSKSESPEQEASTETPFDTTTDGETKTGWQSQLNPEDQVTGMPSTYALNDEVLLEQTQFTSTVSGSPESRSSEGQGGDSLLSLDPNSQPPLAVLDQCVLLALCLNIRNTQPAHGLTANQMSSFIARVISHPRNWMVHTMSLLLRARLESTRTRTVERSVLQLQALIDQMPTSDSTLQERLRWFHALDLPPKWAMQAELAKRYASIGVTRSALEIFERVEMWDEVVQCLGMLGRQQEGIEVIRDLLQGRKVEAEVDVSRRKRLGRSVNDSAAQQVMFGRLDRAREAKLWCLLGDLEPGKAEEHYSQAWRVSRDSSARAARSLGGFNFARENHAEAVRWLRAALRINPLFTRSWFVLGCALMRLEKWKDAAHAFRRCTQLDEEDAESWNNLASYYLRMSEASDAVEVEQLGMQGQEPSLDDDDDDVVSDTDTELERGSDSGVELSSDSEAESDAGNARRPAATASTPVRSTYNLKLLAHRSLGKALKYAFENWRVWYNFMIVSVDVGLLSDAVRAMVRVVEIQSRSGTSEAAKEAAVDIAVLERLVDAAIRPSTERSSNEGEGLYVSVRSLFDDTLLTRISSSPTIWRIYARLVGAKGENGRVLDAHLNAWRHGGGADEAVDYDETSFVSAASQLGSLVHVLRTVGPLAAGPDAGQEAAMPDWRFQARSLVRSFLSRTKQSFEDTDEYESLKEVLADLRG